MRYTKEERLEVGRKVYKGTMNRYEAAEAYGISDSTVRDYMMMYRDSNSLPPKSSGNHTGYHVYKPSESQPDISDYEPMTKKELIIELIKAKMAKKYILLDISNTR